MKKILLSTLLVLALFAGVTSRAFAGDLETMSGQWSIKGTNDNGDTYTATIEFKKDKFTFRMMDSEKKTFLYAKGDIKLDKCNDLKTIKFTNIQGGQSADDLNPVDDDRSGIYVLDGDSLTIALNFDHFRDKGPRIDVYTKAKD